MDRSTLETLRREGCSPLSILQCLSFRDAKYVVTYRPKRSLAHPNSILISAFPSIFVDLAMALHKRPRHLLSCLPTIPLRALEEIMRLLTWLLVGGVLMVLVPIASNAQSSSPTALRRMA